MKSCACKSGFTLIELLVVVLIIGILAAIALPQYQKAVRKSRLASMHTALKTIQKGIDLYWLEHGTASKVLYFSGMKRNADLDITIPCANEDAYGCYTDVGKWDYSLRPEYGADICLLSDYYSDGTSGNNWLAGNQICWSKDAINSQWNLMGVSSGNIYNLEICDWWRNLYGSDRVVKKAADLCYGS